MILYNCFKEADGYRITKFDNDFNVESSYITTEHSCDCPAGHRPSCRHRDMLGVFLKTQRNDSHWFLEWDTKGWHKFIPDEARKDIPLRRL